MSTTVEDVKDAKVVNDGQELTINNINVVGSDIFFGITDLKDQIKAGEVKISFKINELTNVYSFSFTYSPTAKKEPTLNDVKYTAPEGLSPEGTIVYNGYEHPATIEPAEGITGMGKITVKYERTDLSTNE